MGSSKRITGALSTHSLMADATGEIVAENVSIAIPRRSRYTFPGGFGHMGLVYISKLVKMDLPALGYRLTLTIIEKANYGGLCNCSNEVYARELGVDKTRISRTITTLHNAGILHRIGPRVVFLSPVFFFRGSPEAQQIAIDQWADLRRMRLVKDATDSARVA